MMKFSKVAGAAALIVLSTSAAAWGPGVGVVLVMAAIAVGMTTGWATAGATAPLTSA